MRLNTEHFLNMTSVELLSWWIYDQCKMSQAVTVVHNVTDIERVLSAYEAYGREGVSQILGDCGYVIEGDNSVKTIGLTAAKGILTKMRNDKDMRIFHVVFVKRSDQTIRRMRCRFGVTKGVTGVGKAFDDKDYDLKTVWDMDAEPRYSKAEQTLLADGKMSARGKGDYRSISLENMVKLTIGGQRYIIEENRDLVDLIGG